MIGIKVIRTWAFNSRMPSSWGQYDEGQFQGLDLIISLARKHGLKLVLALGNFWEAYRSPEDWMIMAGVDPGNIELLF